MQQNSSRRIMMTLAHNVYEEQEERHAAIEIVSEIVSARRRMRADLFQTENSRRASSQTPVVTTSAASAPDRVAHNVAMCLRDKDKTFSGALGESWMAFVDKYIHVCRDYALSQTQKLQYMHNLLSGDAKRFYLDRVDGYATSYQQAIDLVEKEYNSPVLKARVKNYLNNLRISTLTAEGLDESAALSKIYKVITKLSRQGPVSHRGDAHKVEFLRNAAVESSWSHETLSRVATHSLTFQQLYGELEAALQLQ